MPFSYRPPVLFEQPDDGACASSVAAQALYMCRVMPRPNVAWIDGQIDRHPDEGANFRDICYPLLRSGLRIHRIDEFDTDRFLREGLPYFRSYFAEDWTPESDGLYTQAWADETRSKIRRLQKNHAAWLKYESTDRRKPTTRDVLGLLRGGNLVMLAMRVDAPYAHAVLTYGLKGGRVLVYNPSGQFLNFTSTQLEQRWMPRVGIVAVRPR